MEIIKILLILLIVLCVIGIILGINDKNYTAAIWAATALILSLK